MAVSPLVLQNHIDYTAWASRRLVEAAAGLSSEELNRDFATANRSVLGTLAHIYFADGIWLARIHGEPAPPVEAQWTLDHLGSEFQKLHGRWKGWVASLTAESPDREIPYSDLRGNQWKQPLWQIILHVVNHASHHRGQVSGFLRAMGHPPPPIDLSFYQRGQH